MTRMWRRPPDENYARLRGVLAPCLAQGDRMGKTIAAGIVDRTVRAARQTPRTMPVNMRWKGRRGLTLLEVLIVLLVFALLVAILIPAMSPRHSRIRAYRAVCRANARGIAQSMHLYANDNREWFPVHYFEANVPEDSTDGGENEEGSADAGHVWTPETGTKWTPPFDHGVRWVGMMGTTEQLSITEETSPTTSPRASHPSRSLYLLVIGNQTTVKGFVCPESGEQEDALRNFGPDAAARGNRDGVSAAQPGVTRFDFAGYDNLSYGMRFPYSGAKFTTELDPRSPLAADKGPYFEAGDEAVPGTKTVRDRRSSVVPNLVWRTLSAEHILGLTAKNPQAYNSRNHKGAGQVVAFADGHSDFVPSPFAGIHNDNIYTMQELEDPLDALIGRVPSALETIGPMVERDTFIVP